MRWKIRVATHQKWLKRDARVGTLTKEVNLFILKRYTCPLSECRLGAAKQNNFNDQNIWRQVFFLYGVPGVAGF